MTHAVPSEHHGHKPCGPHQQWPELGRTLTFWSPDSLLRALVPGTRSCCLNAGSRLSKALQREKMIHGFGCFSELLWGHT